MRTLTIDDDLAGLPMRRARELAARFEEAVDGSVTGHRGAGNAGVVAARIALLRQPIAPGACREN